MPFLGGEISWRWQRGSVAQVALGAKRGASAEPDDPVRRWLEGYLAGETRPLPSLAPPRNAWDARLRKALARIRFGQTTTYAALARSLGTSPRAAGRMLAANRLPVLVPCHRVVGTRAPGGFSAGSLWKAALLAHEARVAGEGHRG